MLKNQKGFTLIEMMVVLLIISVLLIITIPNISNHNANINDKGCKAYLQMVEAQVQAYRMDNGEYPTSVQQLVDEGYLNGDENGPETACTPGTTFNIGTNGEVIAGTSDS